VTRDLIFKHYIKRTQTTIIFSFFNSLLLNIKVLLMTEQLVVQGLGSYFYEYDIDRWGLESFYLYQRGDHESVEGEEYTEEQAIQDFRSNLLII
jgi:hypothetical protein